MLGDLLLLRHRPEVGQGELPGIFHQAATRSRECAKSPVARVSNSAERGIVPFGQKCGKMSFSVNWALGSHHSANPLSQPIMNAPVCCTSRACRSVKG
jgi:hypothetical protein